MKTRAEMMKEYKDRPTPMGIFLVRNTRTNEFVLGAGRNPEGALNRYKFLLKMGRPDDPLLKSPKVHADYAAQGEESFEFKVLDTLKPKEDPGWDPAEDLQALEKMWREELKGRGWVSY